MVTAAARKPSRRSKPVVLVRVWEDDPQSGGSPVERPAPALPRAPMRILLDAVAPAAGLYEPGTPEFRYWVAAETLQRAVGFWAGILPRGTTWQRGPELTVRLDAGDRLNALYNRENLVFFHATVGGVTVYTGESPDVVAHELGHAVLDALRPQLWDAMSHEVAAFHEAFGDMSAMLCALQLPSMRHEVLAQTGGLYRVSRLSRVAEQLGWAVRQRQPCAADPDCLRNAVNCFFYQPAAQLPAFSPAGQLSSAPHNFSRVFTGGFFETFAGMVVLTSRRPTADDLLTVSVDAGRLLVAAVQAAPVVPAYFSQVVAHLLEADRQLFDGKYATAIQNGFRLKGILSLTSMSATPLAATPAAAARGSRRRTEPHPAELPRVVLAGRDLGLDDRPVLCRAAGQARRLAVTASALDGGPSVPAAAEEVARDFLRELLIRGQVQLPGRRSLVDDEGPFASSPTHELVEEGDALAVVRRSFEARIARIASTAATRHARPHP